MQYGSIAGLALAVALATGPAGARQDPAPAPGAAAGTAGAGGPAPAPNGGAGPAAVAPGGVSPAEVVQRGPAREEVSFSTQNAPAVLTDLWKHQVQEVAELKAQRERFQAQNWGNAVEVLDRLISDHQRLADQTAGLLRARLSVQVPAIEAVAGEQQPFVSDDPLAMIDHDIAAHRQMIEMVPAELAKVSLPGARYMLGTALQGARIHLQLLEQLRVDVQAGRREATLGSRSTLGAGGGSDGGATVRQDDVRQVEDKGGKR